jgi:hypothetical protein
MFASIVLLGAFHGVNPGMGWLFAVALGLQAQSGHAVLRALGPLALGHALAIAAALALGTALGIVLPLAWIRLLAAAAMFGIVVFSLLRHVHPRGGGMQVGARQITIWSFLVATAHGAGLMLLPFALGLVANADSAHSAHLTTHLAPGTSLLATLIHSASYLAVTTVIALLVYKKLGLRLLRSAWINMNHIWAVALIGTAVATVLL